MRLSMYYEQKTKTTQKNTKKPPKNKNIYFIYVYLFGRTGKAQGMDQSTGRGISEETL